MLNTDCQVTFVLLCILFLGKAVFSSNHRQSIFLSRDSFHKHTPALKSVEVFKNERHVLLVY